MIIIKLYIINFLNLKFNYERVTRKNESEDSTRRLVVEVILLNFRSKLGHMDKLKVILYYCNYL